MISQLSALMAEKEARTGAQRKVSSQLLYAVKDLEPGGHPGAPELHSTVKPDADGRTLVDLHGAVDDALLATLTAAGGTIVKTSAQKTAVRVLLPLKAVEQVAGLEAVTSVRPAFTAQTWRRDAPGLGDKLPQRTYAERVAQTQQALAQLRTAPRPAFTGPQTNAGAVLSEGSTAHGAERARKFFATDGTGIKVGVLSDSDDFKEQSIATGDLPASTVTVPGEDGRPGSGEGTAMMQIVHDVAPGAQLFFATAFNSPESFADNIRTLRFTYHCDIILDDILYYFESPYQDDLIAAAVDDVTADGALYFSSAGNGGNFNDGTSGTWEGDFRNGGTLATLPAGYTVHDFGAGIISNRLEVGGGPLYLHWSDPGSLDNPRSSNDYDLFLLDSDLRNVVVASTDVQDGTGMPFEFLGFNIPPGYRVLVAKKDGAAVRAIRVVLSNGELGLSTPGNTAGHNSAPDAFGMAAVDVAEASGGEFSGGPTTQSETYSSDGNRRVFYSRTGVALGGGVTFASGGGQTRRKPDLTAADGVSTTLPSSTGLNPFFGTSAAAPHAGAVAALLKSAIPTANPTKIRNALRNGALDIRAPGVDRDTGAGIISAFNSLVSIGAKPSVFLERGTVSVTGSGTGGAVNPGGTGTINVTLLNNGGASAGVVRGTLTSSTPGVSIVSGVSTYPNIPPSGTGTNATPFRFAVDPSVPCGTHLAFHLSVAFTGRGTSPTALDFTVATGHASTSHVVTSYSGPPVAIPDDNAAGVNVPLTVSGVGPLATLTFRIDGSACTSAVGATTVGVDHSWVGDLIFNLTSPAGTTVTLISQAGGTGNSGNNFCQTVLQDGAASSIQSVTSAGAPFTGTFSPANPEAVFSGENADGTWVLNVSDNSLLDTGSVRAFSLDATTFSCD